MGEISIVQMHAVVEHACVPFKSALQVSAIGAFGVLEGLKN